LLRLGFRNIAFVGLCAVLAACGGAEQTLLGDRLDLNGQPVGLAEVNRSVPISLPRQTGVADWTHVGSNPRHVIPHAQFGAQPALIWAVPIGQGNTQRHRISATPVSDGQRIFTLDSRALLVATGFDGARLWSTDLTRPMDKSDDASGGGMAVVDGKLFVATGFGDLFAIDAASGAQIWRQRLGAPVTGAPTVVGGQVYVTTRDSQGWVVDAENGRLRWQVEGAPSATGVSGGAGPAVDGTFSVFPFASGQISATYRREGFSAWESSVTGGRLGQAYARVVDVTGDPVISGGRVYVGNPGGRAVALDLETGTRVWTANHGALGPMVLAGGSAFMATDEARVVRLNARDGSFIWGAQLPDIVPVKNQRRQRDVYAHYGPILAGGRIWVASGDGALRGLDPSSGAVTAALDLGKGAATAPIVVKATMFVVNRDGNLFAFR
jgi:outer membrane protein assembly factor BamB